MEIEKRAEEKGRSVMCILSLANVVMGHICSCTAVAASRRFQGSLKGATNLCQHDTKLRSAVLRKGHGTRSRGLTNSGEISGL